MADETDSQQELTWQLRVSPRVRYAKLQIKPYGGLEVVIPPRFPRAEIPFLVAKHADWARYQLDKQDRTGQTAQFDPPAAASDPGFRQQFHAGALRRSVAGCQLRPV